jgi:uncharacterized iron-regulated membrane protein
MIMNLNILNRKVHYWAAIIITLPILVVIASGILLQLKKELTWVQPPEQRGSGKDLPLDFSRVIDICRTVPQAGVQSWADVNRIDVRPSRGPMKVWANSNWEIQIDTKTGAVLQFAYRRSDIIEAIHDGSWVHDRAKLWIFLPSGIILFLLWLTGMYLFFLPITMRARRQRALKTKALAESRPARMKQLSLLFMFSVTPLDALVQTFGVDYLAL